MYNFHVHGGTAAANNRNNYASMERNFNSSKDRAKKTMKNNFDYLFALQDFSSKSIDCEFVTLRSQEKPNPTA
jgi:hypothetical protein